MDESVTRCHSKQTPYQPRSDGTATANGHYTLTTNGRFSNRERMPQLPSMDTTAKINQGSYLIAVIAVPRNLRFTTKNREICFFHEILQFWLLTAINCDFYLLITMKYYTQIYFNLKMAQSSQIWPNVLNLTNRYKSDQTLQIWPNVINLTKRYKSDQTLQSWPIVTTALMRVIWYLLISCLQTFPFALQHENRSHLLTCIIFWLTNDQCRSRRLEKDRLWARSLVLILNKAMSLLLIGKQNFFYADGGKLFSGLAILVDHFQKDSVGKHLL